VRIAPEPYGVSDERSFMPTTPQRLWGFEVPERGQGRQTIGRL
jgi:hypothetical protein